MTIRRRLAKLEEQISPGHRRILVWSRSDTAVEQDIAAVQGSPDYVPGNVVVSVRWMTMAEMQARLKALKAAAEGMGGTVAAP